MCDFFLLLYLYTRITNCAVTEDGSHFGKSLCILEEDDIAFVFNKLQKKHQYRSKKNSENAIPCTLYIPDILRSIHREHHPKVSQAQPIFSSKLHLPPICVKRGI